MCFRYCYFCVRKCMSNEIYKVYKNILFFTAPFCKREFLILNLYKEDECKIEHEFHLKSWKCLNLIFIVLSTIKYFDTVALDLFLIVLIDQKLWHLGLYDQSLSQLSCSKHKILGKLHSSDVKMKHIGHHLV